jgi:signal transduction histidine kinase
MQVTRQSAAPHPPPGSPSLTDAVLRAQARIAELLSRAREPDEVTHDVVTTLCSLGFAYGHWLIRDAVSREWSVRARHVGADIAADDVAGLAPAAPHVREGVASAAFRDGVEHWRVNVEEGSGVRRRAAAIRAGLHSWVAVPVRTGNNVAAVIELFSTSPDPRNDLLESALRGIALQLGHLLTRLDAEHQLETIVRTVPSAVFQCRMGERRTIALFFMSGQIERLWDVPARVALEHPRRVLWRIPRAHRRELLRGLSEAALHGTGWDVTVPLAPRKGHARGLRWVRIHAAPREERGGARVWDGIISDVTEQKTAERQIVLLNLDLERRVVERTRELAEVNEELEAFTASVSHDLRAPLRGLISYADLLRNASHEDAAALADRIVAQGRHMEQLIEALLELSHIGRWDVRRAATDLSALATAACEELDRSNPARTVRWRVQPGMRALADARLMRVLFENLLGNAWKFTRGTAAPVVEVGTDAAAHDAGNAFFVRDNGAGFDPARAARLFQPFHRLHPASRFEGTGIGLATVQRIVRRHGGRIWAQARPEEGATFFFELAADQDYTRDQ